jgi:hypothetical protein
MKPDYIYSQSEVEMEFLFPPEDHEQWMGPGWHFLQTEEPFLA